MNTKKLLCITAITCGGILIGMVIDGLLLGIDSSPNLISLAIGSLLVITNGWMILKS